MSNPSSPKVATATVAIGDKRFEFRVPVRVDSSKISVCQLCSESFGFLKRKYHCHACGNIFCYKCTDKTIPLPQYSFTQKKVCISCFKHQYEINDSWEKYEAESKKFEELRKSEKTLQPEVIDVLMQGQVFQFFPLKGNPTERRISFSSDLKTINLFEKNSLKDTLSPNDILSIVQNAKTPSFIHHVSSSKDPQSFKECCFSILVKERAEPIDLKADSPHIKTAWVNALQELREFSHENEKILAQRLALDQAELELIKNVESQARTYQFKALKPIAKPVETTQLENHENPEKTIESPRPEKENKGGSEPSQLKSSSGSLNKSSPALKSNASAKSTINKNSPGSNQKNELKDALSENREKLQKRTEDLSRLDEKTSELRAASEEFAMLAKQLRERNQ